MTAPVKVNDIAFVRFQAPDLDVMEEYLVEFGMQRSARDESTLYMRGTDDEGFVHVTHQGAEPGFVGLAFAANTEAELDSLALLDGFSSVGDLDGPGGGRVVRTVDPNGFQVEVVAGRGSVGRLPLPSSAVRNDAAATPRIGSPVRMAGGPSQVDTFEPKPLLQRDDGKPLPFDKPKVQFNATTNLLKSPWNFQQYGEAGLWASDLFPNVGKQLDDVCMLHSLYGSNPSHGGAKLKMHTGSDNFVRPSIGSW